MADLPRPVTIMIWSHPAAIASSTPYWMMGLSTRGSISFGCALVAGRKRVPRPAAGKTALRTLGCLIGKYDCVKDDCVKSVAPGGLSRRNENRGQLIGFIHQVLKLRGGHQACLTQ